MKNVNFRLIIRYLLAGILTTSINILSFFLLIRAFPKPQTTAIIQVLSFVSWLFAVCFSYFVSKGYVFKSRRENTMVKFFLSRLISPAAEGLFLFGAVEVLRLTPQLSKLIVQVPLMVVNFVLSVCIFGKNT